MLPDTEAVKATCLVVIGLRDAPGRVGRERDPGVHEHFGVMVGGLGHLGDLVDEGHRAREVLELEVVNERVVLDAPVAHILSRVNIVSLVPSATELLFALGLEGEVSAVTHECDHPPAALALPRVTRDVIGSGLGPAEIDRAVRELTLAGKAIYELDEARLAELAPDLIVTQALCSVCAVSYEDVLAVAQRLDPPPAVVSLDPHTLGEVLGDVRTLAQATDRRDAGLELIGDAARRIDRVRVAVRAQRPVRVAALEWLDPVFVAGHWTPQMIEFAGGVDVLGLPGEPSERRSWEEVAATAPDVAVVMPCGYDAPRALEEAQAFAGELAGTGAQRIVAVDASAYFSRPGPRLIDGLELMAHILHSERVPESPGAALELAL
jgi:iron complex transport system substrate-binding protein